MSNSSAVTDWLTWAFAPSLSVLIVTLTITFTVPVLLHLWLYRTRTSSEPPTFVLIGPGGGGKTSLLTLFSTGTASETHTSQAVQTAYCHLPTSAKTASDQYRSAADPSHAQRPPFRLLDTPGHGKLRSLAFGALTPAPKGLLFVADSAAVSAAPGLAATAEFLHDVLLNLQRGGGSGSSGSSGKASKSTSRSIPVCIIANKQDVFSSLPPALVRARLESEIARVRLAKSKGLLDSDAAADADDDETSWLGEYGAQEFKFEQMVEHGVDVTVIGGNVRGEGGQEPVVKELWDWIAEQL